MPFQLTENRYVLYLLCEHSSLAFLPERHGGAFSNLAKGHVHHILCVNDDSHG